MEIRLILGSENDAAKANVMVKVLNSIGLNVNLSFASCHRNADELSDFVKTIKEPIIVFFGGMSLAAPGIIRSLLVAFRMFNKIVYAVPTDEAARSAIEDLPEGTPVMTGGLNTISLNHGLKNNGLNLGHLVATMTGDSGVIEGLNTYYDALKAKKSLVLEAKFDDDGLIPLP